MSRDLARSGSKIGERGVSGIPHGQDLLPLRARSRASLLLRPSGRIKSANHAALLLLLLLLPKAWERGLSRDLARSGSKISQRGVSGKPHGQDLLPLRARSRASLLLRPPGRIKSANCAAVLFLRLSGRIKSANHAALLLLLLPKAWERGLSRDLARSGSKISQRGVSGIPHGQDLLPLRARSRASLLLRPPGRIKSANCAAVLFLRPSGRIKSANCAAVLLLPKA